MALKNTTQSYGSLAKFFHWTISSFIILLLIVGSIMTSLPDGDGKSLVYLMHKSFGITVLSLALLRLTWRLTNPTPRLPTQTPRWEKALAHLTIAAFYLLMLGLPLSGWIMSTAAGHPPHFFGLFTLPAPMITKSQPLSQFAGQIHEILAWTITGLLSLHIAGALKNHIINKNNLLKRMMPGG